MVYNEDKNEYEGYIYKITNKLNGHSYIGKTNRPVEERWYEHTKHSNINKKSKNTALCRAFKKYGVDNFNFEVIDTIYGDTENQLEDNLKEKEIYYITLYNTHSKTGYNCTDGGDNVTDDNKCNKEIDVYDLNGNYISEYKSMALASKELDVSIGSISQCCNGAKYNSKGFVFRFKNEPFNKFDIINPYSNKKPVYQYDLYGNLLNKYDSIVDAANVTNIKHACISIVVDKPNRTAGGYVWSTNNIFPGYEIKDKINMYDNNDNYIKTYDRLFHVKEDGFRPAEVNGVLKGRCKTHRNHKFFYASDPTQPDKSKIITIDNYKQQEVS